MDYWHLYKAYNICESCSKWKRLYLEEKQKYEDLKKWTEEILKSNQDLLDKLVGQKVGYIKED